MDNSLLPCCRVFAMGTSLLVLVACGPRQEGAQPPPPAPDTATLGGPGLAAASCSVRTEEALQRINAARAAGRRCGARAMPPAPPLHWNAQLQSAAAGHSLDMARRNYFEHRSPDGRGPRERVSASRYRWKDIGENISGGDRSIAEAVQGWLDSPQHCENLMDAGFGDVAVACAAQPGTEWGTYWTMVLGRQ